MILLLLEASPAGAAESRTSSTAPLSRNARLKELERELAALERSPALGELSDARLQRRLAKHATHGAKCPRATRRSRSEHSWALLAGPILSRRSAGAIDCGV